MGNAALKQHYDTAAKTGVLQLSDQKLKEIPVEACKLLEVLRNLDVSKNRIVSLTEDFDKFKLLKQLNLEHNKLETLPNSLGNLKKLELLNASQNNLSALPTSFTNLSTLKQLYLSHNSFRDFPKQIIGLPNLEVVDLSSNKITEIPKGMSEFYAAELNISQNEISKIGEDMHKAPRLKILRLDENCLSLDAISPSLLRDSKLHTFSSEGNLFETKELVSVEGYNEYTERYTAMKKKMF